ncbi:MAG: class I SAM-dependent methyltransferase, partial [Actinomycetota bacterium]
ATRLPFKDSSFDSAHAAWVFHLISDWRDVVAELLRVLRPAGKILVAAGSFRHDLSSELRDHFRDSAGITDWPRGPKGWEELDAECARHGLNVRSLPEVSEQNVSTLADEIRALEEGVSSMTWGVDEANRKEAADAVREWAEASIGSLTEERVFDHTHEWRAYELPK